MSMDVRTESHHQVSRLRRRLARVRAGISRMRGATMSSRASSFPQAVDLQDGEVVVFSRSCYVARQS